MSLRQIGRTESFAFHEEITGRPGVSADQRDCHDGAVLQVQIGMRRHDVFDSPLERAHPIPNVSLHEGMRENEEADALRCQSAYFAAPSATPAAALLTARIRFSRTSSVSRLTSSGTVIAPRSPSTRSRTATVPAVCSLSPTTSMYGTFSSWASRILAPIFSGR